MLTYFIIIIIIKIIINFGFYNLTICSYVRQSDGLYIMYTFCYKNIGRANAPLKLLAPDWSNLIWLRICAG